MAGPRSEDDHHRVIGTRLPAWRQALSHLGEQLAPGQHERQVVEPIESVEPDMLSARIGARVATGRPAISDGNAPWRRALRER